MSEVRSVAVRLAAVVVLGATLAGCMTDKDVTGSIQPTSASREVATGAGSEARWRELAARYGPAYEKNPNDAATAYAYGVTLRALGQRAQALAVLEAASLRNPNQKQILAAYGRALADAGRFDDALAVLGKAHTPDAPDWRILNAQGAILDQLGRSDEARAHYDSALKIAPGEPSVLSNLGLSYALSKDLTKAEATLAQAALSPKADEKVRANLAMVQRLKAGAALAPKRNG
ncbi:tetratricopeptide repeat protein [Chenggangzhangella methanolivorans]|uniref:Tetratricopeptide repeat protein n=1 Tax=Chenggangzhangella methanolivorans TaxID=1437009 RepID=A0A9E6R675_9HYPH|nr:tetratricopeptide repeat protein [Chenggangzhangella methanolivorans]QZN98569.1 tetratricopeptide repeat protein [Chenggangzhangella methanolivorans]